MQSVRLILVRHAQHDLTVDDGPLTPVGEEQARALRDAVELAPGDLVVSSPLRRARATAGGLDTAYEVLDDLDEFRFGDSPPSTPELIEERADLALWRPEHGFPGGETLRAFQLRVAGTLEGLTARSAGRRVVAVTHSGVVDAALRWAFGATPDSPWVAEATILHASITEIEHWPSGRRDGGAPTFNHVHRIGDVAHLSADLLTGS